MGKKAPPLGFWLVFALFGLGVALIGWISAANTSSNGITTQGTVLSEQSISCGKSGIKNSFSVQFTDQTGQTQTSTISQCDYADFNASIGDSVTIIYPPNDPTTIATPDEVHNNVNTNRFFTIISIPVVLILLTLWIRKRIRTLKQPEGLNQQGQTGWSFSKDKGPSLFRE